MVGCTTKSIELIAFLFRELDMDAKLIIQMHGKTTGILNSKVPSSHIPTISCNYVLRQMLVMRISDTKSLLLITHTGPMMKTRRILHLKREFIAI